MGSFNLEDYETVQSRIEKFYKKYPEGRIITELAKHSEDFTSVIFSAMLFKANDIVPVSTGWAMEVAGDGYVNKTSHLENCETSAIGRALANIGMCGDKRPSKEEMQSAKNGQPNGKKQNGNGKKEYKDDRPVKIIGDVTSQYWEDVKNGADKKPVRKIDGKWHFVEYIKDMGEEVDKKDVPAEKGNVEDLF